MQKYEKLTLRSVFTCLRFFALAFIALQFKSLSKENKCQEYHAFCGTLIFHFYLEIFPKRRQASSLIERTGWLSPDSCSAVPRRLLYTFANLRVLAKNCNLISRVFKVARYISLRLLLQRFFTVSPLTSPAYRKFLPHPGNSSPLRRACPANFLQSEIACRSENFRTK